MASKMQEALASWRKRQAVLSEQGDKDPKPTKRPKKTKAAPAVAPSAQAGPVKATVRRPAVPLAKQLKTALETLQQHRLPLTAPELEKACGFSAAPGTELADALKQHDNVEFTSSEEFCYKAQHVLTNKEEVLAFLARRPEGTHLGDIKDTYKGIVADVEKLRQADKIIAWKHFETEEYVLYPKDSRLHMSVDADLVAEWLKQPLPTNAAELEAALRKAKIQPLPRQAAEAQPQHRKGRQRKQRQVQAHRATNEHLPELFAGPQARTIE